MASCMNLSPFWSSGYETFYSGTGYLLLFRHIEYDLIMNGQKVLDQNLWEWYGILGQLLKK